MEKAWQYTDSTEAVVYRVNEDGTVESCYTYVDIVQNWVNAGNTILPATNDGSYSG